MNAGSTNDGIARWRQIADALRGDVADGSYTGRLPAEADLAHRFAVNRHTVRRAIAVLTAEGVLQAERGRGTFVAATAGRLPYPVGAKTRFSENVTAASREPGGRLIGTRRELASLEIAERLDCRPRTELIRLETLRVADRMPMLVATRWLVAERFPGIVQAYAEFGSVTKAFEALGVFDYRRLETRVTAEPASAEDAAHLGCAAGTVLLQTLGLDGDPGGRPIQLVRTRFLADRIELVFTS